jgi:hypothetical protein
MCDPLEPIEELRYIRNEISCLVDVDTRSAMHFAILGVQSRLDWVIANLTQADEGHKNMGVKPYELKEKTNVTE